MLPFLSKKQKKKLKGRNGGEWEKKEVSSFKAVCFQKVLREI